MNSKSGIIVKKKPNWLDKKIDLTSCQAMKRLLRKLDLHTVCEESGCPNISECFLSGVATFMILGDICTRNCKFCGLKKGTPLKPNPEEPLNVMEAVKHLKLNYVVLTSPTRDDLADQGSSQFCEVTRQVKQFNPSIKVEVLISDFLGNEESIKRIASCGADVIAHNIETVPFLYNKIRNMANYERSLEVLRKIKEYNKSIYTKSGLMLGLGETEKEVTSVLKDLRVNGCDILTLGQYLPPSKAHYPLKTYVSPEKFKNFEEIAQKLGFIWVKSAPYVRSSYLAHTIFAA